MVSRLSPADVLRINRQQARALAERVGVKEIRALLTDAHNDLRKRLDAATKGFDPATPTGLREMRVTLAQVEDVTRSLAKDVGTTTARAAKRVAEVSVEGMTRYLSDAQRSYGSAARPLAIREGAMLRRAVSGADATVLRRLATTEKERDGIVEEGDDGPDTAPRVSLDRETSVLSRYSVATIGEFETQLSTAVATGKPWLATREALITASPFLQGAPVGWAERIARTECLLGETSVTGGVVRAAFRRWYEGDVVEVVTEAGRKFTATPNHPMLTLRSWVGAGEIHEGDHLVCYVGKQDARATGDQHVAAPPSTVGEIFDALAAVGIGERRRTAQPDFHGDGRDGEVKVARADWVLRVGRFAALYEPLVKQILTPPYAARLSFCERCHRLLSIQKQPCLCRVALVDASLLDAARDGARACAEHVREVLRALATLVPLHDLSRGQVLAFAGVAERGEAIECGFRAAAHQPISAEPALEGVWSNVGLGRGALGAQPGDVEFDRVREVRARRFVGHVFNLQTEDGYFAINGAYTGNTMGAYNRAGWESIRSADDDLGDMVKILCASFDDRTGWDSYQVHGQIRLPDEAFEWAGGIFQHPPNRPNDREVVVPHRKSWAIPPELAWRGDGEVMAAWRRDRRKGAPPGRPEMTTVPLSEFGGG